MKMKNEKTAPKRFKIYNQPKVVAEKRGNKDIAEKVSRYFQRYAANKMGE